MLSIGQSARRFSPSQNIYIIKCASCRVGNVHYRQSIPAYAQSAIRRADERLPLASLYPCAELVGMKHRHMPPVRRETAGPMAWILATSALNPETTALSVGLRDGTACRRELGQLLALNRTHRGHRYSTRMTRSGRARPRTTDRNSLPSNPSSIPDAARPDRLCSQPYGVGPDVLGQGYMRWRESIALLAGETACPGLTEERAMQARF